MSTAKEFWELDKVYKPLLDALCDLYDNLLDEFGEEKAEALYSPVRGPANELHYYVGRQADKSRAKDDAS